MTDTTGAVSPTLESLRAVHAALADQVLRTPTWRWQTGQAEQLAADGIQVVAKLELLQHTGTFKFRGALNAVSQLTEAERAAGVTAVSAGNHAIAVAEAAKRLGVSAKVVMMGSANKARVDACAQRGAEIVMATTAQDAFDTVRRIENDERRSFIHPFEGPDIVAGAAGVGLELADDAPGLDAVIVPVGGGGLLAGTATALSWTQPDCDVYGIEPEGAASMSASLAAGKPMPWPKIDTVADSLGPPASEPYSFALCQRHVADVERVTDSQLRDAMRIMQRDLKLAVEPAGAAALAGLLGPLRDRLHGKKVGLIVCGSNIDPETYTTLLTT